MFKEKIKIIGLRTLIGLMLIWLGYELIHLFKLIYRLLSIFN